MPGRVGNSFSPDKLVSPKRFNYHFNVGYLIRLDKKGAVPATLSPWSVYLPETKMLGVTKRRQPKEQPAHRAPGLQSLHLGGTT